MHLNNVSFDGRNIPSTRLFVLYFLLYGSIILDWFDIDNNKFVIHVILFVSWIWKPWFWYVIELFHSFFSFMPILSLIVIRPFPGWLCFVRLSQNSDMATFLLMCLLYPLQCRSHFKNCSLVFLRVISVQSIWIWRVLSRGSFWDYLFWSRSNLLLFNLCWSEVNYYISFFHAISYDSSPRLLSSLSHP